MKILFVHGTGVRGPAFSDTLEKIRRRVAEKRSDIPVEGCNWGKQWGSAFQADGLSIPNYDTTRAALDGEEEATDEETMAALWELLQRDPLFELRLTRLVTRDSTSLFSDVSPALESFRLRVLAPWADAESAPLLALLPGEATQSGLAAAGMWLANQEVFDTVLSQISDPKDLAGIVARALVARLMILDGDPVRLAANPGARDALVKALATFLAGSDRSILSNMFRTMTKPLLSVVARPATRLGAWRRGRLMDAASPAAGDILVYQARGKPIRDFIRADVRGMKDSVVLIAHSLGGVACADLLIEEKEPAVKLLITVGSQAPYFYEIGALSMLTFSPQVKPQERLPQHVPDWLNFYDPRDFLSFVGDQLFGARVKDQEVDNGLAFPDSHSGYWDNDQVWKHIHHRLAALT